MAELITADEARNDMPIDVIDIVNSLITESAKNGANKTSLSVEKYDESEINAVTEALLNGGYDVFPNENASGTTASLLIQW